MMIQTPQIECLFPKLIYIVDNVLEDQLSVYEEKIKKFFQTAGTYRDNYLAVDSTHRTNDNLHLNNDFADLANIILKHVRSFANSLGYNKTSTDRLMISNMWSNISYAGDFVGLHTHPGGFISGAYYIKKFTNSKISFFNPYANYVPPETYNYLSDTKKDYDCEPGRLMLWMSDFLHGTEKQTEGEKIVISFNIVLPNYVE